MKWTKYLFLLGLPLFALGMAPVKKKQVQVIEGLFYVDRSPVRIEMAYGKITAITRLKTLAAKDSNVFIGPGLIDGQVNGYVGVTFSLGDARFTKADVLKVTKALWAAGVTTYLPTLRTNSKENLLLNLGVLLQARQDEASRGSIAGFHLEGPYISPVDGFRGAHALAYVRRPDWNEFMQLYEAAGGNILEVTVAPEIDGVMDFIRRCRAKGIVVGLGHHNASAQQVTEAVDNGAQIATHFGNAVANTIDRHKNPLWSQLSDDRLMISMIGDGFHLLPEELRTFYKVKGPDHTIIVSDVDRYAGMKPGKYLNSEGDTIQLTTDGAVMYLARNSLSGSASPVTKGVGNVMKVTGCTMEEAFRMGSGNAARLFGLKDRGELKPGLRADIIVFTLENAKIVIQKTVVAGEVVYEKGA
ncbi:MAG TPA: amidohydrolase family protein [Chitinophaga sp.]